MKEFAPFRNLEQLGETAPTPLQVAADTIPEERWSLSYPDMNSIYSQNPILGPVYGERVASNGEIERCSHEDMVAINEIIANEILVDEKSHTPILTEAPYPDAHVSVDPFRPDPENDNKVYANNDAWLITIRNGHWPIPKTDKGYDKHDYSDKHLAIMMLAPRELQEQITLAAHHELSRRLERVENPNLPEGLILRGEHADEEDPIAFTYRGAPYRERLGGITVIDQTTDEASLLTLIAKLTQLSTDEEREAIMQTSEELANMSPDQRDRLLEEQAAELSLDDDETWKWVNHRQQLARAVFLQKRVIVGITNFNMRHAEGRNLTEEEQNIATEDYLAGILRVAHKLHNNYPQPSHER